MHPADEKWTHSMINVAWVGIVSMCTGVGAFLSRSLAIGSRYSKIAGIRKVRLSGKDVDGARPTEQT